MNSREDLEQRVAQLTEAMVHVQYQVNAENVERVYRTLEAARDAALDKLVAFSPTN